MLKKMVIFSDYFFEDLKKEIKFLVEISNEPFDWDIHEK